ncbi:MAG: acetoacetate--CoA ligase [SAR202 cluster bacterium]|nr:acetoacetate--CoA ligase [SAR202 cluster bacterium]
MPKESAKRRDQGSEVLWRPSAEVKARANITRYMEWLRERRGLRFRNYQELWQWSVNDLEGFWSSIWEYFQVKAHTPYKRVLNSNEMPGTRWFEGSLLNYAEHALSRRDDHLAVIAYSEARARVTLTYDQLHEQVASMAAGLRRMGVTKGDRVAAYMPNVPEALVAFLATASIGAIWSSCPPEFGLKSVVDRFKQIEPKVLFAVEGYVYRGKPYERMEEVAELARGLPSVERVVMLPLLKARPDLRGIRKGALWEEAQAAGDLEFEPVPFDHPLWVLYSSGTTGLPKPIVQGHGGILLEHLKALSLHLDLTSEDRFFWYTTTGWMMWNFLIGGLLVGSTVLLYDGHPSHPDSGALWKFAQDTGMTYFGASAPYLVSCMKEGVEPSKKYDLSKLRGVGSTGAPLPPEGFRWAYEHVKGDALLNSFSGGTDICTGIVGACPLLPVRSGEIPCRLLGASVEAYNEAGKPVVGRVGELVITKPMPSMPLYFWNDPDNARYREAYFEQYPGVWRHGDWIEINRRGGCVIYGRSDSTLKRGGVRMGTSEFYSVVEAMPEVADSLVVDTSEVGGEGKLLLFVALKEGVVMTDEVKSRIKERLRRELSPRYTPDVIYAIDEVPYTLNGKKLEVPVKRVLLGAPVERAVNLGEVRNPEALRRVIEAAKGEQDT